MKEPTNALFLSVFVPGAGLAYLGKWVWAFINLVVVILIFVAAALLLPEQSFKSYIPYISLGWSFGSGVVAQAVARRMNKNPKSDTAV